MTRVLTLAGVDMSGRGKLYQVRAAGRANMGDSAIGEVTLYDDLSELFGAGPNDPFIWKQWSLTEDASGGTVYLERGRLGNFSTGRGEHPSKPDEQIEWNFDLEDSNRELLGFDVQDEARPEETDVARVAYFASTYLEGSPRASTDLDTTTWVIDSDTVTMPAKTYTNTDVIEVLLECASAAGKKVFVSPAHELHYYTDEYAGNQADIEISDGIDGAATPDGVDYFEPHWKAGPALSWDGQDYASRVRYVYADEQSVLITDATSESAHDYRVAHVFDTEVTDATTATYWATTEAGVRAIGQRSYHPSLLIPASETDRISRGQTIWIHAKAPADSGSLGRVRRRIAELQWEPANPTLYWAHLTLDQPIKTGRRPSVVGKPGQNPQLRNTSVTVATSTAWKATSTGTPPAGWHEVGFDDSAYPAAVVSTPSSAFGTDANRWIWRLAGTRPDGEERAFRTEFNLSADPLEAHLTVSADNGCEVYINATLVATYGGAERGAADKLPRNWKTGEVFAVDPTEFSVGLNCLSIVGWNEVSGAGGESPTSPGGAGVYVELAVDSESGTGNGAARSDHGHVIESLVTPETDTSQVLRPDGLGGLIWTDAEDDASSGTKDGATSLFPSSTITATKDSGNPTFNFNFIPENINKIGDTYYAVGMDGDQDSVLLATATDRDGPWTTYASNPIYEFTDVSWAPGTANIIYAPEIVEDDGTFFLFYSIQNGSTGADGHIGMATASAITGPFTDHGSALLSPGAGGTWDSLRVGEPSVLHHDGQWVMAYMGDKATYQANEKVGIATASSPTGTWTKAAGNPLIDWGSGGEWDDALTADPFIFFENGYYWIWYTGGQPTPWESGLAYALTPTGTWTKHADNPMLEVGTGGSWDDEGAWRGSVWVEEGLLSGVYGGYPGSALTLAKGGNFRLTVTAPGSGGATELDELSDVTITSAATGDRLRYNGTAWVNLNEQTELGRWEVVVSGSAPPVATTNEAEDDWVYGWVSA